MKGRGKCPRCGEEEQRLVSFEEQHAVRHEDYDPARAAVVMASLGLLPWEDAMKVKSDPQIVTIAGPVSTKVQTICCACGSEVTWARLRRTGETVEVELPTSWSGST